MRVFYFDHICGVFMVDLSVWGVYGRSICVWFIMVDPSMLAVSSTCMCFDEVTLSDPGSLPWCMLGTLAVASLCRVFMVDLPAGCCW